MFSCSHFADTSVEELTQAWNRCWKGYSYETHFTTLQMKAWLEKCQIDLSHSVALRKSRDIIGFSLLAVDNRRGWIAGTCIQPEFRGQQLFEPLLLHQLERAKELKLKGVQLEVLSHNHAYKVYEKVGFQSNRDLYVYRYGEDISSLCSNSNWGCTLRKANLTDYFQARSEAGFHPPWQRQEGYLKRYTPLRAWLNPEGTSGILMPEESLLLLDVWTTTWEHIERLMNSILTLTQGGFVLANQPKDLLTAYLNKLGIKPSDIQHEMIYTMHQSNIQT